MTPRGAWLLARHLGPGWLAFRVRYAARKKLGLLERRLPVSTWDDHPLGELLDDRALADPERLASRIRPALAAALPCPPPVASLRTLVSAWDDAATRDCVEDVRHLVEGNPRYFFAERGNAGFPPAWHRNPFTGAEAPMDHWSRIDDFGQGDIKVIWEPNRFAFVFDLVRAAWRTGEERPAELFWMLIEDWRSKNPPQTGPAWMCGQETALRMIAMIFGLVRFVDAPATTDERIAALVQTFGLFAGRIEANLDYALSQRNNHGISEALGLWTLGVIFPGFRDAARWKKLGARALESQTRELFTEEGAFSQSSMNYHRLALQDLIWALLLADRLSEPLAPVVRERFHAGTDLLDAVIDPVSGGVPRYGANDGALVLPLDGCDHGDFRPAVQACRFLLDGRRRFESGPWDESLLWLHGAEALDAERDDSPRNNLAALRGGYWTLRSNSGFAFTRCGRYDERPGHADLLHLDTWWRGRNVALDPGTFSYNAPPPWDDGGGSTLSHNTVTVDGLDQMERWGRFLWLPWARGRSTGSCTHAEADVEAWEGSHDGYARLRPPVAYRRAVLRLGSDQWLVLDRLEGGEEDREFLLHWLLADGPYESEAEGTRLHFRYAEGDYHVTVGAREEGGVADAVRGGEGVSRGWAFPYYQVRIPAVSLSFTIRGRRALFWTLLGPSPGEVCWEEGGIRVRTREWAGRVRLAEGGDSQPWISAVTRDAPDGKAN